MMTTSARKRTLRWLIATVFVLGLAAMLGVPAFAQGEPPSLDEINDVARELYCPLCNGVRLDTCDLTACEQMRQVIATRLSAGVPKDQIKEEFVAQYGPVVLGEPPREGLNWLAWILPIGALVAGAVWLFYTARRWTRQPVAQAAAGGASSVQPDRAESDPYLARVESDLAEMD